MPPSHPPNQRNTPKTPWGSHCQNTGTCNLVPFLSTRGTLAASICHQHKSGDIPFTNRLVNCMPLSCLEVFPFCMMAKRQLLPTALGKAISHFGLVHGKPLGTDSLHNIFSTVLSQLAHVLDKLHCSGLLLSHRDQIGRTQLVAHQVRLDLKQKKAGRTQLENYGKLTKRA